MIEYLILNEESLPFKSRNACDEHLPEFFKILKNAFDENSNPIRVSEKFGGNWYQVLLAERYSMKDWIKHQEKEYSRRIRTLISKTAIPRIPPENMDERDRFGLSQFYLSKKPAIETPCLGVAFLLNGMAVSFLSDGVWDDSFIDLKWHTFEKNGLIVEKKCEAKNAARFEHWALHLKEIHAQRKENCRKGIEFWKNRRREFPNLIFCGDTEKTFQNLSIGNANFSRLWDNLKLLNEHIRDCRSDRELKENTGLNFSDESNRVKTNEKLRRYREFTLPGEPIRKFFGLHVKNFPGAFRLHFLPDYKTGKIYIGYFGKHLPL